MARSVRQCLLSFVINDSSIGWAEQDPPRETAKISSRKSAATRLYHIDYLNKLVYNGLGVESANVKSTTS
ncbi:hypothetical protein L204_103391 [Cryptococcus depauperatus]